MRYYDLSWPRVEKNTKINPKMQTNNHSNVTNVKHGADFSLVTIDGYPAPLL